MTERELTTAREVLAIFADCSDDEMATVLMACVYVLGDRLAHKMEAA